MTKGRFWNFWSKETIDQTPKEKQEYSLEIGSTDNEMADSAGKKSSGKGEYNDQNNEEISSLIISRQQSDNKWTTGIRGTFLSVCYFLTMSTLLIFCMNFVHRRMPRNVPPLPDMGHELIPKLEPEKLGDFTMMSMVVTLIVCLVLNRNRWPIIIRFLITLGNLYILRIVSISVTSLPPTENHCRYEYKTIDNIYLNTLKGLLTLGGGNIHCGDLMFSGHTCMVTNIWMTFMTSYKKRYILKVPITILMILTFYFIIATRSHYTGDIWIAFWLTFFVFKSSPSTFPFTKQKIQKFLKNCF